LETNRLVSQSEILDMIHRWLIEHIQQEDKQMQRYFEVKNLKEENPQ